MEIYSVYFNYCIFLLGIKRKKNKNEKNFSLLDAKGF